MKKWMLRLGAALLGVVVLAVVALRVASDPLPEGVEGPEAEAMADALMAAVDAEAWERTGAVAWTFAGRNEHLWDRQRQLARLRSGETTTLVDLTKVQGRAWKGDRELTGRSAERAVRRAHAAWINDAFWLNPVVKLRDDGTSRRLVQGPDGPELMLSYSSGGLTPGDSYLWRPGPDGRPVQWRMWVSVIPLKGLATSWEGWTRLDTGAWVSTAHQTGPLRLALTDVRGAATLAELEPGPDPFAPLNP